MLPPKAKIKFRNFLDAEMLAQEGMLSVTRRVSELSKSLATQPTSEAASIEAEIDRLRVRMGDAQIKHRFVAEQNARLRYFVETLGAVHLEDAKAKIAKVDKGETLRAAATRVRTRITALSAERQKVRRAGLPAADAKKMAAEHVAKLAERGRPLLRFDHDNGFRLTFNAMVASAYTTQQDIGAAMAYLDPTALLKRINDDIDAVPKPPLAMSPKARAEKLAMLDAELLTLEFEDEAIVEASEIEGPIVQRRPDADPRAVLTVTVARGKPAPAKTVKVERDAAAPSVAANPNKSMSEKELIEAFGDGRLLKEAGDETKSPLR